MSIFILYSREENDGGLFLLGDIYLLLTWITFRYQVYEPSENLEGFNNNGVNLGFRPQNPGPYGPNGGPLIPAYQGNNGVLVGPGGPTGIIGRYLLPWFLSSSSSILAIRIFHVYFARSLISSINRLFENTEIVQKSASRERFHVKLHFSKQIQ